MLSPCGDIEMVTIAAPDGVPSAQANVMGTSDPYILPVFIPNYDFCDIVYSFTVTPSKGTDGIFFNSAAESREFTYDFAVDETYLDVYEITVTA